MKLTILIVTSFLVAILLPVKVEAEGGEVESESRND